MDAIVPLTTCSMAKMGESRNGPAPSGSFPCACLQNTPPDSAGRMVANYPRLIIHLFSAS